jgi:adenosylcobinamide-GDP ribazoletransferase
MNQLRIFLTAVMFYTRIPVPKSVGYSQENMSRSTVYLPIIGLLVGAVGGGVYLLSDIFLPTGISVLLCMIATILLTGAFHEDSIADFCDGFGGGRDKEGILRIMKDSHIGTYGTVGLILTLGMRYLTLSNLYPGVFLAVIIAGNAYSRFQPVLLINTSEYMRKNAENKAGGVVAELSFKTILISFIFALIPMLFLPLWTSGFIILIELITFLLFRLYVHRKLGGYTGDVLGALQQISEIVFYLSFLILYQLQCNSI